MYVPVKRLKICLTIMLSFQKIHTNIKYKVEKYINGKYYQKLY